MPNLTDPKMTAEYAVSELRRIRYDWKRMSLPEIARLSGISVDTLYRAINTGYLSPRSLTRLTAVLRGTAIGPNQNPRSHAHY